MSRLALLVSHAESPHGATAKSREPFSAGPYPGAHVAPFELHSERRGLPDAISRNEERTRIAINDLQKAKAEILLVKELRPSPGSPKKISLDSESGQQPNKEPKAAAHERATNCSREFCIQNSFKPTNFKETLSQSPIEKNIESASQPLGKRVQSLAEAPWRREEDHRLGRPAERKSQTAGIPQKIRKTNAAPKTLKTLEIPETSEKLGTSAALETPQINGGQEAFKAFRAHPPTEASRAPKVPNAPKAPKAPVALKFSKDSRGLETSRTPEPRGAPGAPGSSKITGPPVVSERPDLSETSKASSRGDGSGSWFQVCSDKYVLQDSYKGNDFWDLSKFFFFEWGDPTGGTVQYLGKNDAQRYNLMKVTSDGRMQMLIDTSETLQAPQGRKALRITSQKSWSDVSKKDFRFKL